MAEGKIKRLTDKGFGFIDYVDPAAAASAVQAMNGFTLAVRYLTTTIHLHLHLHLHPLFSPRIFISSRNNLPTITFTPRRGAP